MKKASHTIILLVILNIVLLIILIYGRFFWIDSNEPESIKSDLNDMTMYNLQNKNYLWYQATSDNTKLNKGLIVRNENGDTISIKNLFSKPSLVLRYSELNCQSCVDIILKSLLSDTSFNENNTLILGYYREPDYLYQFKRINSVHMPIFNIWALELPPDTLNVPYIFLIDNYRVAHNVFIPEQGDSIAIKNYLSFAAKKLKNM
ncbi:MAG TPA: hypothetical protein VK172_14470 [Lentimicrobium sp.]|nr:hypothetical protein [Lentimicrobium sp.]